MFNNFVTDVNCPETAPVLLYFLHILASPRLTLCRYSLWEVTALSTCLVFPLYVKKKYIKSCAAIDAEWLRNYKKLGEKKVVYSVKKTVLAE